MTPSSIRFVCPRCQAVAEIDGALAGQAVVCPGCESVVLAPLAGPAAAPKATAPAPVSRGPAAPRAKTAPFRAANTRRTVQVSSRVVLVVCFVLLLVLLAVLVRVGQRR